MSGLELLIKIRKNEKLKDIPFLMLTGITDKTKADVAIKSGATDYVIKLIQASSLIEKINKCLA